MAAAWSLRVHWVLSKHRYQPDQFEGPGGALLSLIYDIAAFSIGAFLVFRVAKAKAVRGAPSAGKWNWYPDAVAIAILMYLILAANFGL